MKQELFKETKGYQDSAIFNAEDLKEINAVFEKTPRNLYNLLEEKINQAETRGVLPRNIQSIRVNIRRNKGNPVQLITTCYNYNLAHSGNRVIKK